MFGGYASFFWEFYTVKVVKIQDWRPRAFCLIFLLITAIIGVWLVILTNHGYCEFHTLLPTEYKEGTWWDDNNPEDIYPGNGTASYCDNKNFDYYYNNDWQYINNSCAWNMKKKDIMKFEKHKLRVLTNFGNGTRHGKQAHVTFIPHVEELNFTHHMNVIYKGKMEKTKFQLEVEDSQGVSHDQTHKLNSPFSPWLTFNLKELLSMMDVVLDEPNYIATDSHKKNINGSYKELTASYRLTGLEIMISLETSNYKFQGSVFDHLEYITKVKVEGFHSVKTRDLEGWEYWNCAGYESIPSIRRDFHVCGISVHIIVLDGTICNVSYYAIFQSLLQLTVLFGIATFFVDNFFQFCSRTYRVAKITTDTNEWEEFCNNRGIIKKVGRERFKRAVEEGRSAFVSHFISNSPVCLTPDEILEMESIFDDCRLPKMELHDSNDSKATSPSTWKIELHCSNDSQASSPSVWKFPLN